MVKLEESDKDRTDVFLKEVLGLAPLTQADTARLLEVIQHTSVRQEYCYSQLSRFDEAGRPRVGKQMTDVYMNAAHTRHISVKVARYLSKSFDSDNVTKEQYSSVPSNGDSSTVKDGLFAWLTTFAYYFDSFI